MKINRQELLDILTAVKPGLAAKEIIEQATHFVFSANEVYTYNDKISISCEIDLNIGEFTIQGEELYKILNKLKEDEIDLEIKNVKLKIKSGKTTASLSISPEINLPEINLPDEWTDLPKEFTKAIKFCLFSVSKNISKLALSCLQIKEKEVRSCDNHRLTFYTMDSKIKKEFLLTGSAAHQLVRYKPTEYAIDNSWVHFNNEAGVIFSCRAVEIEYPDLAPLLETKGEEIELPKELIQAIDKAKVLITDDFEQDRFISLQLSKNKLKVKGEGQLGWIEEEMKIKYSGENITLKVHPDHFVDILIHLKQAAVNEKSIVFSGSNFVHSVSLIA